MRGARTATQLLDRLYWQTLAEGDGVGFRCAAMSALGGQRTLAFPELFMTSNRISTAMRRYFPGAFQNMNAL